MSVKFGPILITGADTGIGRATAIGLANRGYKVYASVYSEINIEELEKIDNVNAFKLDVTNPEDISAIKKWIEAKGEGLYGIVNNAGIGETWPLIESTEEEIHRIININLYGVIRVTTALMPLLTQSKGRVVTIGSLSGTIPTKFIGAYSVSKFAVEAFVDVLSFEVKKMGIKAITIKPGNMKSDITKAGVPILISRRDRFEKSQYKAEFQPLYDNIDNAKYLERRAYETPERVIDAIAHALYSENPKSKYLVANEEECQNAINWMCRVIAQLNQNQDHSLDKATIHQFLDKQLDKFQ
ncbi:MAG: 3-oxoacyl-[acyl-carrier-protein] reductase FabG [Candidatus Heimdallarchaeota archaeon LC_2]|nr:MAG: 3-oxoacyl-[acyl-carrier-protein] reductase FabG [Candidatus Heimdallarchaeota archaeon LC_2]